MELMLVADTEADVEVDGVVKVKEEARLAEAVSLGRSQRLVELFHA